MCQMKTKKKMGVISCSLSIRAISVTVTDLSLISSMRVVSKSAHVAARQLGDMEATVARLLIAK